MIHISVTTNVVANNSKKKQKDESRIGTIVVSMWGTQLTGWRYSPRYKPWHQKPDSGTFIRTDDLKLCEALIRPPILGYNLALPSFKINIYWLQLYEEKNNCLLVRCGTIKTGYASINWTETTSFYSQRSHGSLPFRAPHRWESRPQDPGGVEAGSLRHRCAFAKSGLRTFRSKELFFDLMVSLTWEKQKPVLKLCCL